MLKSNSHIIMSIPTTTGIVKLHGRLMIKKKRKKLWMRRIFFKGCKGNYKRLLSMNVGTLNTPTTFLPISFSLFHKMNSRFHDPVRSNLLQTTDTTKYVVSTDTDTKHGNVLYECAHTDASHATLK